MLWSFQRLTPHQQERLPRIEKILNHGDGAEHGPDPAGETDHFTLTIPDGTDAMGARSQPCIGSGTAKPDTTA